MSTKQAEILFICGSPRERTSEALLALLEQGVRDAGARSRRFLLSKKRVAPCTGCGSCEKTGDCIMANEESPLFAGDDYAELMDALAYADALAVVSPLYFAGPPAQLKALYDRMQPFWAQKYLLGKEPRTKRPAQIFILGGGGDSHGYDPMVTISRSALAVAGFSLEKIQNFIGFKHTKDVAPLPTEDEAAGMALGELAHLRKAAAMQREFEQRALAAGSAFARFVGKSMTALELKAELQQVEEEMAELQADAPVPGPASSFDAHDYDNEPVIIVNQLDSDFEMLKQNARAAKASNRNQAKLNAVIEEAVAVMTEHSSAQDASAEVSVVESMNTPEGVADENTVALEPSKDGAADSLSTHASGTPDKDSPKNSADDTPAK